MIRNDSFNGKTVAYIEEENEGYSANGFYIHFTDGTRASVSACCCLQIEEDSEV